MKLKRSGIFTKLLLIVLILYAIVTIIGLHSKIEAAKTETSLLAQEVEDRTAQNEELRYYIENSDKDEVKEDIARDHNYVKQGEKVYKAIE